MNTIVKNTIFSVATCALLLSMQGCGEDRAGYKIGDVGPDGNIISRTVPGANSNIPNDDDHDWITNDDERQLGTNPNNADSDGDGLIDGCETGVPQLSNNSNCGKTDPKNPDSDGDGLKDGYELATLGTDPNKNDSDNDNLCDGDEVGTMQQVYNPLYNNNAALKGICSNGDKSTYTTDPLDKDTDDDGLEDGTEVTRTNPTDPTDKDSDNDMISDGMEVKANINTDPNDFDSDNDGVSDGIEVCGTYPIINHKDNDGKITSAGSTSIGITDGNTFYKDVLSTLVNKDNYCATPADYNNDGQIDAKDPSNDSDGDERPNNLEQSKSKDPLHQGLHPTSTDKTVAQQDLDNNYYYPWITQTPDGKKMKDAGFEYIPKSNSKGFWMSKYEAVFTDANHVKVTLPSGGDKADGEDRTTSKNAVENSKSDLNVGLNISLPTKDQYNEVKLVKSTVSGNCIKVQNTVGDTNMPKNSVTEVCEIIGATEYTDNGTVNIENDGSISDSSQNNNNFIHFRAATPYIQ